MILKFHLVEIEGGKETYEYFHRSSMLKSLFRREGMFLITEIFFKETNNKYSNSGKKYQ